MLYIFISSAVLLAFVVVLLFTGYSLLGLIAAGNLSYADPNSWSLTSMFLIYSVLNVQTGLLRRAY